VKLIDYFKLKAEEDKNCPHCIIGQTSDGLGVFWCERGKEVVGMNSLSPPPLPNPPLLPSATAEPCLLEDWAICPLNPNNTTGGS